MATYTAAYIDDTFYGTAFITGPNAASATGHLGGFSDAYYLFLNFDLTGLPIGATITSAILSVTITATNTTSPAPVVVRRATSSWSSSTLTYAIGGSEDGGQGFPTPQTHKVPIWDSLTTWATFSWTNTNGATNTADITTLVNAYYTGLYSNLGIVVVPLNYFNGATNTDTTMGLHNNATSGNRPSLVITYTPAGSQITGISTATGIHTITF